jgi:2-iminobutanoate/2-iminopropanoate deaminase
MSKLRLRTQAGQLRISAVDVYVKEMTECDTLHRVRREYFPDPPPASTMVAVSRLVHPDCLIEISAIPVVAGES